MLVKPRETAFASAEGFDTAAIAFSGVIRYGSPRYGPHLEKTAAREEHFCNLGEYRVSAAVTDIVAMFFFKYGFEGSAHSGFLSLAKR